MIPYVLLDDPRYGEAVQLSPLVRRVIANNPSKFTYHGTGTYIIGRPGGAVAVVDPGPDVESHRDALIAAVRHDEVAAILVTHCHGDHSTLARWLSGHTGAPTMAAGPHGDVGDESLLDDGIAGADDEAEQLAKMSAAEIAALREDVDVDFVPDQVVADGDTIDVSGTSITAVFTPGHASNHTCYAVEAERTLCTGDHVMGWSTTVVSPPDGDMADYMVSLRKVAARGDDRLLPTHGAPIDNPQPFLAAYTQHREDREEQVLGCLHHGVDSIAAMVDMLYVDVRRELHRAAGRSVRSHLLKLVAEQRVATSGVGPEQRWWLTSR